ncbi:hypothetical protein EZV62_019107 [Acer yangbiense]|uniref:Geranylgeranyl transferase type II subunit beta n=1 Tax=Acer yangbiense TaxID=1000413 RepID=A0A5C7HAB9_9ROSI|nr:hypothetical protein EZV62_019107 [Acer yangbiense]
MLRISKLEKISDGTRSPSYGLPCFLILLYVVSQYCTGWKKIDVDKAVNYIVSCKNLDGGFGCTPGGESHAGQIKSGGLNGRPEKLPDVGLSLPGYPGLKAVDPAYALPVDVVNRFFFGK